MASTESPTYAEHNDRAGLDQRLRVMAHNAAREQYTRVLEAVDDRLEMTQTMSADELRARCREAWAQACGVARMERADALRVMRYWDYRRTA